MKSEKKKRWKEVAAFLSMTTLVLSVAAIGIPAFSREANGLTAAECSNLNIASVIASGSADIRVPQNAIDNNLSTRWSNDGKGSWLRLDLDSHKVLCYVDIAWYKGNVRINNFVISVSTDGTTYTNVFSGKSSGKTNSFERYNFQDIEARYVKVTVNGNQWNNWAAITEIDIYGGSGGPPPTGLTISFANVAENQVLSGTYKVVVGASDPTMVSNIKLYVGTTLIKQENFDPYEFSIDTTKFSDGSYTLKAVATDKSGNTIIKTVAVTFKNQESPPPPPTLAIAFANVAEDQILSGTYKIVVTASGTSSVSNIKLYIDGTFFKTESIAPYEYIVDTTTYADGNHQLKAVATDTLGNTNAATAIVNAVFANDASSPPPPPPSGDLPTAQQVFQSEQFAAPSNVDTFVLYMANEFHEGPGQHKMLSPTNEFVVPKHLTIYSGTKISFHMADARWGAPHTYKIEIKNESTGQVVHTTETIVYTDMQGSSNSQPVTLPPGTYTIDYQAIQGSEKTPHLNGEEHTITVLEDAKEEGANLIVGGFYAVTETVSDMTNGDGDPRPGDLDYYQSNFPSKGLTIDSFHSFVWYSCTEEGGGFSDQCITRPGEDGESWADNKTGHHTLIIWKSTNTLQQVWNALDELTTTNVYI